jgi:hypothetical protein
MYLLSPLQEKSYLNKKCILFLLCLMSNLTTKMMMTLFVLIFFKIGFYNVIKVNEAW